MESRNVKTCFIAAPFGLDTRPLREALAARGVRPVDGEDVLTVGSDLGQTVEAAIAKADFVCAVIPDSPFDATVFLEVGMAIGAGRPALLFVAPKAELPVALRGQQQARATLSNDEALRFHLDAFLKNAGRRNGAHDPGRLPHDPRPSQAVVASALDRLAAWESTPSPPPEGELVRFLAELFEAAGYVASVSLPPVRPDDARPDLAVWIDELQAAVANPLIVEVTTQQTPIDGKTRQLERMLRESRSALGLLACWGSPEARWEGESNRLPLVVVMSVRDLVDAVARGDLVRALLARRNAAVHRAA